MSSQQHQNTAQHHQNAYIAAPLSHLVDPQPLEAPDISWILRHGPVYRDAAGLPHRTYQRYLADGSTQWYAIYLTAHGVPAPAASSNAPDGARTGPVAAPPAAPRAARAAPQAAAQPASSDPRFLHQPYRASIAQTASSFLQTAMRAQVDLGDGRTVEVPKVQNVAADGQVHYTDVWHPHLDPRYPGFINLQSNLPQYVQSINIPHDVSQLVHGTTQFPMPEYIQGFGGHYFVVYVYPTPTEAQKPGEGPVSEVKQEPAFKAEPTY